MDGLGIRQREGARVLRIGVCDDDETQVGLLSDLVRSWARSRSCAVAVETFTSSEQYLFSVPDSGPADVLLLDIDMPGTDGMALAHQIRAAEGSDGAGTQIVFVTGLVEHALEGYEVNAVSYLLKPVREEQLVAALDRAVERVAQEPAQLVVEGAGQSARVALSQVSYLEARGHDTELVLADGRRLTSSTGIARWEDQLEELPDGHGLFVKVHRSYLVSVAHVGRITRKDVSMDTGDVLPVARGRADELSRAWMAWCRGSLA